MNSWQSRVSNQLYSYSKYVVQLYLPPYNSISKDWLKLVLNGDKGFFKLTEVKAVTVPLYDELKV